MKEYRLYEYRENPSLTVHCVDQFSATEQEAIARAKARVKDKPIELWEGAHMVRRFNPQNSN